MMQNEGKPSTAVGQQQQGEVKQTRAQRRATMRMKANRAENLMKTANQLVANNNALLHFIDNIGMLVDVPMPAESGKEKKFVDDMTKRLNDLLTAETNVERLLDALVWCSASSDFQEGGTAREGWEKICQPLLDKIKRRQVEPLPVEPVEASSK